MNILLSMTIIAVLAAVLHGGNTGCTDIMLTGTDNHKSLEGIYAYSGTGCFYGHNTYDGPNGAAMYHTISHGKSAWFVSDIMCSDLPDLVVIDAKRYPENIGATWQEFTNGDFEYSDGLEVSCVDCPNVNLAGTAYHKELEGKYTATYVGCSYNLYIYTGPNYAKMYHMLIGGISVWCIGFEECSEDLQKDVKIAAMGPAINPMNVTDAWSEKDDDGEYEDIASISVTCSSAVACSEISIQGTEEHQSYEGTYTRQSRKCNLNDYYYKGPNSTVLYHHSRSESEAWSIGYSICSDSDVMYNVDTAAHPEDIIRTWYEGDGYYYDANHQITVTCIDDSGTLAVTSYTHILAAAMLSFITKYMIM